ncbi:MAG: HAD-IA family hydrolase, partial [Gaiellaceae bacterium]
LRLLGLKLACVANWDVGLHAELERLRLAELFDVVLTSADVGAPKPAPLIFERALDELEVSAHAAVHIGDEQLDRDGAAAAGMRFEPIPLSTLPERLADRVST